MRPGIRSSNKADYIPQMSVNAYRDICVPHLISSCTASCHQWELDSEIHGDIFGIHNVIERPMGSQTWIVPACYDTKNRTTTLPGNSYLKDWRTLTEVCTVSCNGRGQSNSDPMPNAECMTAPWSSCSTSCQQTRMFYPRAGIFLPGERDCSKPLEHVRKCAASNCPADLGEVIVSLQLVIQNLSIGSKGSDTTHHRVNNKHDASSLKYDSNDKPQSALSKFQEEELLLALQSLFQVMQLTVCPCLILIDRLIA